MRSTFSTEDNYLGYHQDSFAGASGRKSSRPWLCQRKLQPAGSGHAGKLGIPKWISMQNALREEWASSTARSAIDQRRRDPFTKEEVGKPPERVTKTRTRFCATPMRRKTELTNKKAPGWLRETKLLCLQNRSVWTGRQRFVDHTPLSFRSFRPEKKETAAVKARQRVPFLGGFSGASA